MKKITLLFFMISSFVWSQTVRVDVSELTDVANVELLANFGGNFAFFPAFNAGNDLWEFDLSTSADAQNEYLWRVTFNDTSTFQESMASKVGGQGVDNDVAVGQAFNTDFVNFCNRIVVIGNPDPPTFFFNSFRQPGVDYTELTLTAQAPGAGENYYMFYQVNGFSEFGGPGTVDNGDGTFTALVRPDVDFEYKWVLNNNPGTVGSDAIEDILSCTNDGVTINTDNANFANRIHFAGENKLDEFGVCPNVQPVNDFCTGATPIQLDGSEITITNVGATDSGIDASCDTGIISDVWYSFEATLSLEVYFDTNAPNLSVWSGDCEILNEISCNPGSSAVTGLIEGETYYVRINDDGTPPSSITRAPQAFFLTASGMALSTNDFDLNAFKTYPNPTNNVWNIEAANTIESIEVFDILGKRVISLNPNNQQATIDASNLKPGVYLAKLNANGATKTVRLVKQ